MKSKMYHQSPSTCNEYVRLKLDTPGASTLKLKTLTTLTNDSHDSHPAELAAGKSKFSKTKYVYMYYTFTSTQIVFTVGMSRFYVQLS